MKLSLAAALLAAVVLAASAAAGGQRPAGAVTSSRLVLGGNIRITATIATPVQVGRPLRVTFRIRNVSKQPRKIQLDYQTSLWLVVHSPDGTRYDTRTAIRISGSLGGPPRFPTKLRPGAAVTRTFRYLDVRWMGPLRIVVGWDRRPLPAVHVAVSTPAGPAPTNKGAIDDVVADTGGLLANCRPRTAGVAVRGVIDAPKHSAPPLHASCSISLRRERGFVVAQVLIATPPGYRSVHLRPPYEFFTWPRGGRNASAIAWEFVVTSAGATSVDSTSVESTKGGRRMAPDWQWTPSGYQESPGGSKCGGTGGGGGGAPGPFVEFVSVCSR